MTDKKQPAAPYPLDATAQSRSGLSPSMVLAVSVLLLVLGVGLGMSGDIPLLLSLAQYRPFCWTLLGLGLGGVAVAYSSWADGKLAQSRLDTAPEVTGRVSRQDGLLPEPGRFMPRVLKGRALRRWAVCMHPLVFLAVTLAGKYMPHVLGMSAANYAMMRDCMGFLSAGLGVFALVLSSTLANEIVESGKLNPTGFGGLSIAETTASTMVYGVVAFVIFVVLA